MRSTYNIVGAQVRELRLAHGLSQAELAARCGVLGWSVTRGTVAKIESGDRAVNDAEVFLLAKALRKPVELLYPKDTSRVAVVARQAES